MGYLQAAEMIDQAGHAQALSWHLSANHYPPVPAIMIPICQEAINLANDGDYDVEVMLPGSVLYKGRPSAPVWAIIEQHHLGVFLDDYSEQDED